MSKKYIKFYKIRLQQRVSITAFCINNVLQEPTVVLINTT